MDHLLYFLPLAAEADPLATYGLPAVFVIMLLKEAGVPIPIPGDLIMLGAVARAVAGQFDLLTVILVFEVAMVLGGIVQYLLARGPGRGLVYRFGRYVGLTQPRLERAGAALDRGGVPALSLALITPGVRVATVAAAGLVRLPFGTFLAGLFLGNTVFFALHVVLAYAGAQGLAGLLGATGASGALWLLGGGVGLAVIGFAGWWFFLRRHHAAAPPLAEVAGAWQDACCPACLALAVVRRGAVRATESQRV